MKRFIHNAEDTDQVGVFFLSEELRKDPDVVEGPLGVCDTHNAVEQVRSPGLHLSGMVVPCCDASGEGEEGISEGAMRENQEVCWCRWWSPGRLRPASDVGFNMKESSPF